MQDVNDKTGQKDEKDKKYDKNITHQISFVRLCRNIWRITSITLAVLYKVRTIP
jgi:hypothetical protein